MPKVLEINGYRFFFYSSEGDEPCHIHVKRGEGDGKIWLEPELKEEYMEDFKNREKREIKKIVKEQIEFLIEKWYEYFKRK